MSTTPPLTSDQLAELEKRPKTEWQRTLDYMISGAPVAVAVTLFLQYYFLPNYKFNTTTAVYPLFVGFFVLLLLGRFIGSFFSKKVHESLRAQAPFYSAVFIVLIIFDYLTLKTGKLPLPYFPWPDKILNAIIEDRVLLLDCIRNSLILLFTGYFFGGIVGLITGVTAGWSKKVHYWVMPLIKILGPIPSTTWLPIVLIIASSLFKGSVFLIALGVWYPVTIATLTGVANVRKSYFEVARTLGARQRRLIFKVAFPAAMPNIFQGLTQGMSVACTTLMVAEMMGVESGLGWYINWQKGWAEFGKMYAAVIVICLTFTVVNIVLTQVKKRVLRWQEGTIQ
ncbi:NitT/TauT family transport system permease protein [Desulfitobacterium sp. LBE]|uniref:ABC transmembrane type-1 domain-containing protein n=1 Tax=bioreactor metagenome TaxID=1076179 RepID=A0A644U1S9_9ZZZZ|nr:MULTISPECIES: ABC transporter permease subunit [Desulfitobacterium]MEA5025128.1 ABC transporter permease subunit [Desulfitobacterium hafniense]TWH57727.1 NitT/TauT family transport system permease protein [Desulfitobacterium sp. LBE]